MEAIASHSPTRQAPARRTLLAGVLLQQAFGLTFTWGVLVPHVQAELGWPPLVLAAVFSATPLGYGLGTVVGGRLADRLPPRRIAAAAVGLLVLGLAPALTHPSPLTFVVLYGWLGLGMGGGMALAGSVAAAVRLFPARAGTVGGALTAAYAGASIVQAPLLAALVSQLGWLGALRWLAAGLLALALGALALTPGLPAAPTSLAGEPLPHQLHLLRRHRVWTSCLVVLFGALTGAYAAVAVVSQAQAAHLAAWVATGALVVFSLGNTSGRLLGGAGADRLGVGRVGFALLLGNLAAALVLALTRAEALVLVASLAAGGALGSTAGLVPRLAADGAPDAPNSAFGVLFAAFATGALAGPLVGAAAGGGAGSWLAVGLPSLVGLAALAARSRPPAAL